MSTLHITSNEATAEALSRAGVPGEVLPWQDSLHEGPVPAGLSLDEMSRVRARFLSTHVWGGAYDDAVRRLEARDRKLKTFKRRDEVVFWFGRDLGNQLQWLQLLHWFSLRTPTEVRLTHVSDDGGSPSPGFDRLETPALGDLFAGRRDVEPDQLRLGSRGWEAFSSDRPIRLQELLRDELSSLPCLRSALKRHFEQYPSTRDGLNRTERQILDAISRGPVEAGAVYRVSQVDCEEIPFMDPATFLSYVAMLSDGGQPLLRFEDAEPGDTPFGEAVLSCRLAMTEAGHKVLSGQADRVRFQQIERWLGGVKLDGGQPAWRWGHMKRELVPQNVRTGAPA